VTDPPEPERAEPRRSTRRREQAPGERESAAGRGGRAPDAAGRDVGAEQDVDAGTAPGEAVRRRPRQQRKQVLLRLDPAMHAALAKWAADELRSTNAQIDYLLRKALTDAGRLPGETRPHPRRGRPPREG